MKIAWFHVNGMVCRMDPPIEFGKVKELSNQFPDSVIEPLDHFEYEAKMVLAMPFSERQPYIDRSPPDQKERLVSEIKKQFKEQKK